MEDQITSNILMIQPVNFVFNPETAVSNHFQQSTDSDNQVILTSQNALVEFNTMVSKLIDCGVNVQVIEDTKDPFTPDSIFPNNWISFHQSGKIVLYPMEAKNRRLERRSDIIDFIKSKYKVESILDLSYFEQQNLFLEGTGSLVLDRANKIAYACLSSRTSKTVLETWKENFEDYEIISFEAKDQNQLAIYHTNVMMCVSDTFAVICLESISNLEERINVISKLKETKKEIIEINLNQMNDFAGNMLMVKNTEGKKFICMSKTAYSSLNSNQKNNIIKFCEILYFDIPTIEKNGGGSVRCMMAEICLPTK